MALQQHNYDQQIRKYVLQVIRMLSNFQVAYGDGTLIRVPVTYGDSSRQVAAIIKQNSENGLSTTPQIAVYISAIKYARDRVQDPTFENNVPVRIREYDKLTDSYLAKQGNAYSVRRIMPAPYDLSVKVDMWTSNNDQKMQLIEQIAPLFNPSLELQRSDQYLDWASLTVVELIDMTWSNRSIPMGTDDTIDIASMELKMPIWISLPAIVTKMGVIEKIINSIFDPANVNDFVDSNDLLLGTRQAITFQNYGLWINSGQAQLLQANAVTSKPMAGELNTQVIVGETNHWPGVLGKYGTIRSGISQLRLNFPGDSDDEIIGTISIHPMDDKILLVNIDPDTLPVNTLPAITAVIDPQKIGPGISNMPIAALGQRYLLLNDVGSALDNEFAPAWHAGDIELIANKNDIIQFNGANWIVSFDSQAANTIQYVTNLTSGQQYKYQDTSWTKSYEGEYSPLNWRLVI